MTGWLDFIATVIVAIIGLIGIVYQTKAKVRQENIEDKLDKFIKESQESDEKLHKELKDSKMNSSKRFLVTELTKIKNRHYVPTEEQKRVLKDTKDEYNGSGGDSYVDDMYEDCRKDGLI